MDLNKTKILKTIGEKATETSLNIIDKVSEYLGVTSINITGKILTMIILGGLLYLALKIGQKIVKIGLVILLTLLIISIGVSFF